MSEQDGSDLEELVRRVVREELLYNTPPVIHLPNSPPMLDDPQSFKDAHRKWMEELSESLGHTGPDTFPDMGNQTIGGLPVADQSYSNAEDRLQMQFKALRCAVAIDLVRDAITEAVTAERQACQKIAAEAHAVPGAFYHEDELRNRVASEIEAKIRARGMK